MGGRSNGVTINKNLTVNIEDVFGPLWVAIHEVTGSRAEFIEVPRAFNEHHL